MILNAILILAGVAAVASIANLFDRKEKKQKSTTPMKIHLPGNLPIIALFNNGKSFNFLIDSGSNISHICAEDFKDLDAAVVGVYEEGKVSGLGAVNTGITLCNTILEDILGNKYAVNLSISEQLSNVAKDIKAETGIEIHGLLGTDFLKDYGCIIDFDSLEVHMK